VSAMSSSQQSRREQTQPTYAAAAPPTSATSATTTTTMYAPIAERAIPYEQYMSRDAEHIYSASRVTPRNAPRPTTTNTAPSDDEQRQLIREPTVISVSSAVDGDVKTTTTTPGVGSRSSRQASNDAAISAGFDSNTLKRMLQTLPELSTPVVDLMQEFEEEFADVVGPSSTGPRDDMKPPPAPPPLAMPPPPPAAEDEHHTVTTVSTASTAVMETTSINAATSSVAEQHADVTPLTSSAHADANTSAMQADTSVHASTSAAEAVTSDVSKAPSAVDDIDHGAAENLEESEEEEQTITAAPVLLGDVAALATTAVTSSGTVVNVALAH